MKKSGWRILAGGLLAAGLVLGGVLLTAPEADADAGSLLFPIITTEAGKFTFITISNDLSFDCEAMHFTYATKPVPVVNNAACDHFDADVKTTPFDMMIFEVGGKVKTDPPSNVLFEGAAPTTSTALILPIPDRLGFLIVEGQPADTTLDSCDDLFGWATIVDAASGLAWTYSSAYYNNFLTSNPWFGNIDSTDFNGEKIISWFPVSVVTTSWFVLPLGSRSQMAPAGGGGIRRGLETEIDELEDVAGAFDLDEQLFSGGRKPTVRCLGFVTRSDFLQPAVLASTDGGGWTQLEGASVTLPPTHPVDANGEYEEGPFLLFKLQTTTTLGGVRTTINQEPDEDPGYDLFAED